MDDSHDAIELEPLEDEPYDDAQYRAIRLRVGVENRIRALEVFALLTLTLGWVAGIVVVFYETDDEEFGGVANLTFRVVQGVSAAAWPTVGAALLMCAAMLGRIYLAREPRR